MTTGPTYYDVLGVGADATLEEIEKAYRKAAKVNHPDAARGDQYATERFKMIGEAYEVLSDDIGRDIYNMDLKSDQAPTLDPEVFESFQREMEELELENEQLQFDNERLFRSASRVPPSSSGELAVGLLAGALAGLGSRRRQRTERVWRGSVPMIAALAWGVSGWALVLVSGVVLVVFSRISCKPENVPPSLHFSSFKLLGWVKDGGFPKSLSWMKPPIYTFKKRFGVAWTVGLVAGVETLAWVVLFVVWPVSVWLVLTYKAVVWLMHRPGWCYV